MKSPSRRQLLQAAFLGAAGLGAANGLKQINLGALGFGEKSSLAGGADYLLRSLPMDASARLADALRGGVSLIAASRAMAATSTEPVAFLDVFLAMSADCRHFINVSDFSPNNNILTTMKSFRATATSQTGFGDLTKTHPDFAASKVTKWFADIVLNGTGNGATNILGANASVGSTVVNKPITGDDKKKIEFLTFASYDGTGVHQQGALPKAGSISYIAQKAFEMSPNGVATLGDSLRLINESGQSMATSKRTEAFLADLEQFISPSYFHRSLNKDENLLLQLDDFITDSAAVKERKAWLDGLEALKQKVAAWKAYGDLAKLQFNPFAIAGQSGMGGPMGTSRCASIALAGEMAAEGLVTVAGVGLDSFDFHADTVARVPSNTDGNMMTCMVETAVGLNAWANRLIAAKMDGIAFVRTCSGRNEDWVKDSGTVSSIAIIVKGRPGSRLKDVKSAYYGPEGAGMNGAFIEAATVDWKSGLLGLDGKKISAASVEGAVLALLGKAQDKELKVSLGDAKIGKII